MKSIKGNRHVNIKAFRLKDNTKNCWLKPQLIEGLVMKLCHENNGTAIYVGRGTTVNPLFECSHYI